MLVTGELAEHRFHQLTGQGLLLCALWLGGLVPLRPRRVVRPSSVLGRRSAPPGLHGHRRRHARRPLPAAVRPPSSGSSSSPAGCCGSRCRSGRSSGCRSRVDPLLTPLALVAAAVATPYVLDQIALQNAATGHHAQNPHYFDMAWLVTTLVVVGDPRRGGAGGPSPRRWSAGAGLVWTGAMGVLLAVDRPWTGRPAGARRADDGRRPPAAAAADLGSRPMSSTRVAVAVAVLAWADVRGRPVAGHRRRRRGRRPPRMTSRWTSRSACPTRRRPSWCSRAPAAAGSAGCCSASAAAEPAPRSALRSSSPRTGPSPLVSVAESVESWIWVGGFVPLLTLVPLLYPDGRLPGPRWRPWVVTSAVGMGLLAVGSATYPGGVSRAALPRRRPHCWCRPASPGSPRSWSDGGARTGWCAARSRCCWSPLACWSSTPCSSRSWPGRSTR